MSATNWHLPGSLLTCQKQLPGLRLLQRPGVESQRQKALWLGSGSCRLSADPWFSDPEEAPVELPRKEERGCTVPLCLPLSTLRLGMSIAREWEPALMVCWVGRWGRARRHGFGPILEEACKLMCTWNSSEKSIRKLPFNFQNKTMVMCPVPVLSIHSFCHHISLLEPVPVALCWTG